MGSTKSDSQPAKTSKISLSSFTVWKKRAFFYRYMSSMTELNDGIMTSEVDLHELGGTVGGLIGVT